MSFLRVAKILDVVIHQLALFNQNNELHQEICSLAESLVFLNRKLTEQNKAIATLRKIVKKQRQILKKEFAKEQELYPIKSNQYSSWIGDYLYDAQELEQIKLFSNKFNVGFLNNKARLKKLREKKQYLADLPAFKEHTKSTPKIRIAGIFDEFTYKAFAYEAEIVTITPEDYKDRILELKPDIILIESAWYGYKHRWCCGKQGIVGAKVFKLIAFCNKLNLLTIFWNKEDPVSFKLFLPIASLVDIVFTSAKECIPQYKQLLKHDEVYLLPFAVQPVLHNPLEKYPKRIERFVFAGSYYSQFLSRQSDFDNILAIVEKFVPVDIYDRGHLQGLGIKPFPDRYRKYVKGGLRFSEIHKAYNGYLYAINLNTVQDSATMCSRRVFELLASNTVVVSNYAKAINNYFDKVVLVSNDDISLKQSLLRVIKEPMFYRKIRLLGLRAVMNEHTYFERIGTIKSIASGCKYEHYWPPVIIMAKVTNVSELFSVISSFHLQSYQNKQLVILKEFRSQRLVFNDKAIKIVYSTTACIEYFEQNISAEQLLGFFSCHDYYGPNYILDLALASKYSQAMAFGKYCHFTLTNNSCKLMNNDKQYRAVTKLKLKFSLLKANYIRGATLIKWLHHPEVATVSWRNMLAVDEFNYCLNGANGHMENIVNDALIESDDMAGL